MPAPLSFSFCTCDVFTERRFGGNPLAVVLDGDVLSDAQMQAVAREFNFSETVFVLPPSDPGHGARLRIFTPMRELPFAGHPTVGTAFVLASLAPERHRADRIVLEEGIGPVSVELERHDGQLKRCAFSAPRLPQRGPPAPRRDELAAHIVDQVDETCHLVGRRLLPGGAAGFGRGLTALPAGPDRVGGPAGRP